MYVFLVLQLILFHISCQGVNADKFLWDTWWQSIKYFTCQVMSVRIQPYLPGWMLHVKYVGLHCVTSEIHSTHFCNFGSTYWYGGFIPLIIFSGPPAVCVVSLCCKRRIICEIKSIISLHYDNKLIKSFVDIIWRCNVFTMMLNTSVWVVNTLRDQII